jgi:hypothetical protein
MQGAQDLMRAAGRQAQGELEKWFHKNGLKWIPFGTNPGAILDS